MVFCNLFFLYIVSRSGGKERKMKTILILFAMAAAVVIILAALGFIKIKEALELLERLFY